MADAEGNVEMSNVDNAEEMMVMMHVGSQQDFTFLASVFNRHRVSEFHLKSGGLSIWNLTIQ